MVAALEENGYYHYGGLNDFVAEADYVYEVMAGGEWIVVINEEGYDEWVWQGNDELTFEQFEESYMEVADWYGLTEYDLGFVLLGMADENGNGDITEAEL